MNLRDRPQTWRITLLESTQSAADELAEINEPHLPAYCMKDLDFRNNILSGIKYRVSPEGVSLMDETNNLAKQVGRSRAHRLFR